VNEKLFFGADELVDIESRLRTFLDLVKKIIAIQAQGSQEPAA
jgi:hypothetical protein